MAPSKSTLKVYRTRVRTSSCRGLRGRTCNKKPGCKHTTKGKKRNFCRKNKNKVSRRRGLRIR